MPVADIQAPKRVHKRAAGGLIPDQFRCIVPTTSMIMRASREKSGAANHAGTAYH